MTGPLIFLEALIFIAFTFVFFFGLQLFSYKGKEENIGRTYKVKIYGICYLWDLKEYYLFPTAFETTDRTMYAEESHKNNSFRICRIYYWKNRDLALRNHTEWYYWRTLGD